MTGPIVCDRCGRSTTDPDRWDPEVDTGRIFCDPCWDHRHEVEPGQTEPAEVRRHYLEIGDEPQGLVVDGTTMRVGRFLITATYDGVCIGVEGTLDGDTLVSVELNGPYDDEVLDVYVGAYADTSTVVDLATGEVE